MEIRINQWLNSERNFNEILYSFKIHGYFDQFQFNHSTKYI